MTTTKKKVSNTMETTSKLPTQVRFKRCIAAGLILSLVLALVTGLIRYYVFPNEIILIPIGLISAIVIKSVGRGVNIRFALVSVLITLLAIYLSDIIALEGLIGLLDIRNYLLVIQAPFSDMIYPLSWLLFRVITLYIAFAYSRIL